MNDGYRKAALELHNLSKPDRAWMLKNFASEERDRLNDLLNELKSLGIKCTEFRSGELFSDEIKDVPLHGLDDPALSASITRLCKASVAEISEMVLNEPDYVVAAVLSVYSWPWRAQLLSSFGVEKRLRFAKAMQVAPMLGASLRQELISLLDMRLKAIQLINRETSVETDEKDDQRRPLQISMPFWQRAQQWLK